MIKFLRMHYLFFPIKEKQDSRSAVNPFICPDRILLRYYNYVTITMDAIRRKKKENSIKIYKIL